MALAVTSSSASISGRTFTPSSEPKAPQLGSIRVFDRSYGQIQSHAVTFSQRRSSVKPVNAQPKRSESIVPSAATVVAPEVVEKVEVEDYAQLVRELENASPLEIMDKALEKFGNDIAIAFSGAEDVALIEYAHLTGRSYRVFSLDTGRLNPETYQFFDTVEKHYGIRIEYMFPDAVEVQALVRTKGLFSFYEDGHQECCRVRKVRPLRRALKGLRAWITGQRKDQSPGTRSEIPIVQVDPVFEGLDGGAGSLVKWNPVANVEGHDIWNFLRAMNVPVNSLHSKGYISIGCEPCTRSVLPGQHEREGRWWWEDAKAKECGLHKGNIKQEEGGENGKAAQSNGAATETDIFTSQNLVTLSRTGIENLAKLEDRKVLYKKKGKVKHSGNHQFDDGGEACSGTEEVPILSSRVTDDIEVSNTKGELLSPQGQRTKSKKLYFGDKSSCLDALQTLADLSLMMPESMESGSSVQLKDGGANVEAEDKFSVPETTSTSQFRNKNKLPGAKHRVPSISGVEGTNSKKSKVGRDPAIDINIVSESEQQSQSTTKILKRKRKSLLPKISNADAHMDSDMNEPPKTEGFGEEENKPVTKGKRTSQVSTPSKQWKSARSLEGSLNSDQRRTLTDLTGSTAQVPTSSQVNLPTKQTSRRKMYIPRTLHPKEKSCEKKLKNQLNTRSNSVQDRALHLKEKISCCLSSHLLRRWCTFEWFYSALDYAWFAKREFEEYLNHVGLGHIPRLTRVEWGVIRSSLGKPRRFSEHFLHEEREKLKQYRESVRKHYAELRTGVREGLPTDLARPLSVGQRVIALHPKTREVHDGSVLTVDHDKCRVQFDRADIGVEFVMDVDCMPLNPLDNMPEALRRRNIAFDKFLCTSKEPNKNGSLNFGGPMMFASSGHLVKATSPMDAFIKQEKGDAIHTTAQPKTASADIGRAQQTAYSQPGMVVAHNQAREADIQALSELNCALDKKEALLMELRNTNNNILENQNSGECTLKESEPFKKHYAMVSSALVNLRQRNTYPAYSLPPWMKQLANSTIYGDPSSFDSSISQESGSSVADIVEVSKSKAHMMVNAAIQVMASGKCGEDAYVGIREALDSIDNQHFTSESRLPVNRSQEQVNGSLGQRNQISSGTSDPNLTSDSSAPKLHTDADKNEAQILSEVISACVMAVHMIQTCTERQFPPAAVAQVLDYAVTSLHPRCPQNVGIYREIQMCMGRIKTQILALVPT